MILLVIYQVVMGFSEHTHSSRNLVDIWFQEVIDLIPSGPIVMIAVLAVLGFYFYFRDKSEGLAPGPDTGALMILESLVWGIVLYIFLPQFIGKVLPHSMGAIANQSGNHTSNMTFLQEVGMSCGAGFYEELLFRFLMVRCVLWLVGFTGRTLLPMVRMLIIIVPAFLFSLAHYVGDEPFTMYSFIYRTIFGLLMNLLMVFRGFGITAWAHAWYDILVFGMTRVLSS
jgi:hypothetical protein